MEYELYPKLRYDNLADHNVTAFFKQEDAHILLLIKND